MFSLLFLEGNSAFSFCLNPSRRLSLVYSIFYSHLITLFTFLLLLFPLCPLLNSKHFGGEGVFWFWGFFVFKLKMEMELITDPTPPHCLC